jgi:hypothetical protein
MGWRNPPIGQRALGGYHRAWILSYINVIGIDCDK